MFFVLLNQYRPEDLKDIYSKSCNHGPQSGELMKV